MKLFKFVIAAKVLTEAIFVATNPMSVPSAATVLIFAELELTELNTNTKIVFRLIQGRTSPPPARGSRRPRIN